MRAEHRNSQVNHSGSTQGEAQFDEVRSPGASEISRHSVDLGLDEDKDYAPSQIKGVGDFCKAIGRQLRVT